MMLRKGEWVGGQRQICANIRIHIDTQERKYIIIRVKGTKKVGMTSWLSLAHEAGFPPI